MENIIVFLISKVTCLPVARKAQGNLWLGKRYSLSDRFHFSTTDFSEDCEDVLLLHIYTAHPKEGELVSGNMFLPANFSFTDSTFGTDLINVSAHYSRRGCGCYYIKAFTKAGDSYRHYSGLFNHSI